LNATFEQWLPCNDTVALYVNATDSHRAPFARSFAGRQAGIADRLHKCLQLTGMFKEVMQFDPFKCNSKRAFARL
jgi:hypothetical protein